MNRSTEIHELATALAKAQSTMAAAAKDSDNPFFRSKYADLASCWDAWRPAGPPNGLSLMQFATAVEERLGQPIQIQGDDNRKPKTIHYVQRVSVETLLCHSSGQWVSEILTVLVKDDSPQATLSGETYCRRGGMAAMIGIAPDDDDGNEASNHGAEANRKPKGTATARSDAKARADKLASEHGMQTADQLPTLTEADSKWLEDFKTQLTAANTRDVLETIAAFGKDKSDDLRKIAGPLWVTRAKTFGWQYPSWKLPDGVESGWVGAA